VSKKAWLEYQHRRDTASQNIALADIAAHVKARLLV
jgi:hypothetical protein